MSEFRKLKRWLGVQPVRVGIRLEMARDVQKDTGQRVTVRDGALSRCLWLGARWQPLARPSRESAHLACTIRRMLLRHKALGALQEMTSAGAVLGKAIGWILGTFAPMCQKLLLAHTIWSSGVACQRLWSGGV